MRIAKSVNAYTTLRLIYDPQSKEFQNTIASYRDSIYKGAIEEHIITHVSNYVLKFGSGRLIEGVGYISVNGNRQGEPFSGIDLESDDVDFEFEIKDDFPF